MLVLSRTQAGTCPRSTRDQESGVKSKRRGCCCQALAGHPSSEPVLLCHGDSASVSHSESGIALDLHTRAPTTLQVNIIHSVRKIRTPKLAARQFTPAASAEDDVGLSTASIPMAAKRCRCPDARILLEPERGSPIPSALQTRGCSSIYQVKQSMLACNQPQRMSKVVAMIAE